jgi:hypothetical protein
MAAGTPPDWHEVAAQVTAGITCRSSRDYDAALAHFMMAFAYSAPRTDVLLNIAAIQMEIGEYEAAIELLEGVVTEGGGDAGIHLHLAHALWSTRRYEDALAECALIAGAFPHHAGAIETASLMESQKGDPNRALRWSLRFFEARPVPVPGILLLRTAEAAIKGRNALPAWMLAVIDEAAAAGDFHGAQAAELLQADQRTAVIWQAMMALKPIGEPAADPAIFSLLMQTQSPAMVLGLHDPNVSQHIGGVLPVPDALERDGFALPRSEGVAKRGFMTTDLVERRGLNKAARKVQFEIIKAGRVRLHSPFGGMAESTTSFVLNYVPASRQNGSVIAYFFTHPRPSFVFFVSEDHWPLAWYDPLADIVLRHDGMPEFDYYLQDMVRQLKQVCLSDPAVTLAYLRRAQSTERRKMSLMFGMMDYLSTQLFSDLQGIQRLIDVCLLPLIETIYVTAPEIGSIVVRRLDSANVVELNQALFDDNVFAVRVAGGMVDDVMAGRVLTLADRDTDPEWRAAVDRLCRMCFPVIFVSLRIHSRRWLIDPSEISGIFTDIQYKYPDVAVILDGHSKTGPAVSAHVIEEESALFSAIAASLPADFPLLISAGRAMADAIHAAAGADLHLSAQGTSTTKAVLLANKPGVVIGSRQFGWDVSAFRDPPPLLITPWDKAVDVSEDNIQCDFYLDPEIVRDALLRVIDTLQRDTASH